MSASKKCCCQFKYQTFVSFPDSKSVNLIINSINCSIDIVSGSNKTKISKTTTLAMWQPITVPEVNHYVYCMLYILVLINIRDHLIWVTRPFLLVVMKVFPLSVTHEINEIEYEGERTQTILPTW